VIRFARRCFIQQMKTCKKIGAWANSPIRPALWLNIVDNQKNSQFITPAFVDRDPVTVAIGTEGAVPVLVRAIKADLEQRLPAQIGVLARIAKSFRKNVNALPMSRAQRRF